MTSKKGLTFDLKLLTETADSLPVRKDVLSCLPSFSGGRQKKNVVSPILNSLFGQMNAVLIIKYAFPYALCHSSIYSVYR